ncbi:MAG: hypothetical protein WC954_01995 [Sphaerochaeta sp.]
MKQRYALSSITISRAPGFTDTQFPVIEHLSDSLNIVYGPNGVGKSTLLRNIRSLIYQSGPSVESDARGVLTINGQKWDLDRNRRTVTHQRQGDSEKSDLPGINEEFSEAYWFALHELINASAEDYPQFFERAQRQMQGGVDLEGAKKRVDALENFHKGYLKLAKEVRDAKEARNVRQKEVEKNKDLPIEIATLEESLAQRPHLEVRLKELQTIQAYREAKQRYDELDNRLNEYDPRLERLRRAALDTLDGFEATYNDRKKAHADLANEVAEYQQIIARLNVDEHILTDQEYPRRLEEALKAAQGYDERIKRGREELAEKEGKLQSWNDQHAFFAQEVSREENLQEFITTFGELAQSDEALRSSFLVSEKNLSEHPEPSSEEEEAINTLRSLKQTLTKSQGSNSGSWQMGIILALLGIFGSGSVVLGILGYVTPAIIFGMLGAGALILLGVFIGKYITSNPKTKTVVNEYLEISPNATNEELLAACVARLTTLELKKDAYGEAKRLYEVKKGKFEEHLTSYKELYQAFSIPTNTTFEGARFYNIGEHLRSWSALLIEVRGQEQKLRSIEDTFEKAVDTLSELTNLERSTITLAGVSEYLRQVEEAQRTQKNLTRAEKTLAQATAALAEAKSRVDQWYETYEIENRASAEELFDSVPDYNELYDKRAGLSLRLMEFDRSIAIEAAEMDASKLGLMIKENEAELERLEEKYTRLIQAQERYDRASVDAEYEIAELNYNQAIEDLDLHRQNATRKRFTYQIITKLQEQTLADHQPKVIQESSTWLERITHNRYTLAAGDTNFQVKDHVANRTQTLEELSSGTRIQLLFALRMGYLASLEKEDIALPIFFDEIMANSDDERSIAIAAAIGEIALERQVFYATAQLDEVQKLEAQLDKKPLVIDLEALSNKEAEQKRPFHPPQPKEKKTIPFDEDYDNYAKLLGIAQAGLFDHIGGLSAWYLVTTSQELHNLLERNFTTCGVARRTSDILRGRFALLEKAQKLAQEGREKTLLPAHLGDPELTLNRKTNYYQQILDFVAAHKPTGSLLLEAIETKVIKNISGDMVQTLTNWMFENSFLNEEPQHSKEDIIALLALEDETITQGSETQYILERYLDHILAP